MDYLQSTIFVIVLGILILAISIHIKVERIEAVLGINSEETQEERDNENNENKE